MPEYRMDRVVWIDRGWQPVRIGFAPTREAYAEAFRRLGRGPDDPFTAYPITMACATLIPKQGRHHAAAIVTLHDDVDKSEWWQIAGMIAHEAFHVWHFTCTTMGVQVAVDEELIAHGLQHITSQLMNAYVFTRGKGVTTQWQKVQPAKGASRPQKAAANRSRPRKAATR